jgi:AAA15 family ATPase/GTPase
VLSVFFLHDSRTVKETSNLKFFYKKKRRCEEKSKNGIKSIFVISTHKADEIKISVIHSEKCMKCFHEYVTCVDDVGILTTKPPKPPTTVVRVEFSTLFSTLSSTFECKKKERTFTRQTK